MNGDIAVLPKNILLVEDDPAVRQSIKLLLDIDCHTVTEAANGPEALRCFSAASYDLVITDYVMPEMLGDELAQTLKRLVPAQPILMVTAYMEKLANAGKPADAILPKPFGLEALRQAIAQPTEKRPSPALRCQASQSGLCLPFASTVQAPADSVPCDAEITPRDARAHVDSGTLILWVQQEVESLNPAAQDSSPRDCPAHRMLQLLTFAYACHVLASDQVARACDVDPPFGFLCHGAPPFPSEIVAFRRRHRRQLELALARTLARVVKNCENRASACVEPALLEIARQRLDVSRHLDTCT